MGKTKNEFYKKDYILTPNGTLNNCYLGKCPYYSLFLLIVTLQARKAIRFIKLINAQETALKQ